MHPCTYRFELERNHVRIDWLAKAWLHIHGIRDTNAIINQYRSTHQPVGSQLPLGQKEPLALTLLLSRARTLTSRSSANSHGLQSVKSIGGWSPKFGYGSEGNYNADFSKWHKCWPSYQTLSIQPISQFSTPKIAFTIPLSSFPWRKASQRGWVHYRRAPQSQ